MFSDLIFSDLRVDLCNTFLFAQIQEQSLIFLLLTQLNKCLPIIVDSTINWTSELSEGPPIPDY